MLRSDPVADRVSKHARSHCSFRPVSCGLSVCVLVLLGLCAVADAQLVGGRWELVDNDPDHQTNKREIGIWLQADRRVANPQPHSQYDAKGLPLMALRCEQGKSEFFINLNFEVDSGEVAVSSRTDGDAAVDSKWTAEGVALEPGDKVAFVRSLLG
jgi:hypothetical protein